MVYIQSLRFTQQCKKLVPRFYNTSAERPLLKGRYNSFPIDLFRINKGDSIRLRDFAVQRSKGRLSYDVKLTEQMVLPSKGDFFLGPNGASLRPNSSFFQELVCSFQGKNAVIYMIKQGTELPEELTLLHEHTDHYSLQCTKPMKLTEFNRLLTNFVQEHGEKMTKFEFADRFFTNI